MPRKHKPQHVQEARTLRAKFASLAGSGQVAALRTMGEDLMHNLSGGIFEHLLDAGLDHGYRPTCRIDMDPRWEVLADLYDYFMARAGNGLRAFRSY